MTRMSHHHVFTNDLNLPMPADILVPPGTDRVPVLVVLSGHNGFKEWGFYPAMVERFCDAGFAIVNFNFSMCGVREGEDVFNEEALYERNSPTQELKDTTAVLKALQAGGVPGEERFDLEKVGVYGHSLGGGVALLALARETALHFAVLWSSIATLKVWPEGEMTKWRDQGYLEMPNKRTNQVLRMGSDFYTDVAGADTRFNILDAAKSTPKPFVVVHGIEDESVPVSHANDLRAAANLPERSVYLVPGGTHTYGTAHPFAGTAPAFEEALAATVVWLRNTARSL